MTSEPVAVVTTVLNEREGIRVLLDGFLAQTRKPEEIVVVDGGSTDGTIEVLRGYAERHPSIRVLVERGANIARGRNVGIRAASATIIAVTDGGCRPELDWLQELVRPLVDGAEYGAVTGARRIVASNRFEKYAGLLSTSTNASVEEDRVFHGRNSAFRKSLWQAVGGYPEWLYTAEDTLFAQRAKALGCRVALAESAVVSWRPRPTLRKLAKQYFLYGRGTGRIGMSQAAAVRYHLRNHLLWMMALLLSPLMPALLLVVGAVWAYLYLNMLRPAIAQAQQTVASPWTPVWVGLIVMVRSMANHVGQAYGMWEYSRQPIFSQSLQAYRNGQWRMD